ncbi:hypothetical protein C8R46DRAFT_1219782 [Mycena filopes]|nr:hypothetical protein C8R46DRAFT_1219782 [Mycena filopes]
MATCDICHHSTFGRSSLLPGPAHVKELRDILRSNAVPLETSSFRRVAEEAPVELARYDAEIERLGKSMANLLSERASLAWYSDGCRSVASPVRRLPTELLAEIFDMCAPPDQDVISETTTHAEEVERVSKKYLLQLAQVCSHWHCVAMGTPNLWSFIVLDTAVWNRSHNSTTLLNLVTSSLQRGGECPLTLRIAVDHGDRDEAPVLKLLTQHSHRWRSVALWIDHLSFPFLAGAKGNLGRLTFLRLESSDKILSAGDLFQVAPQLKEVWLAGWRSKAPEIPWEQILRARLTNGEVADLSFMSTLSPLSTAATLLILPTTPSSLLQPPVFSKIGKLAVQMVGEWPPAHPILGSLFQSLALPQMHSLRLLPHGQWFPRWEQTPFLDFASRSCLHARLTILELNVIIEDHELLECLAALPLLQKLYIADSDDHSHPPDRPSPAGAYGAT